jgi:hypothetical protein
VSALVALSASFVSAAFAPVARAAQPPPSSQPFFVDAAAASGLDYHHFNGMSGERYYLEVMGPGGALIDYDQDGDLDLYVTQGHMLGAGKTIADATLPPGGPLRHRLYRNDLHSGSDGSTVLRFRDVTEASGIDARGYGMGVAAGDYDNDGFVDLYVCNYGPNQLWKNNGDGTWSDRTRESGTADDRWSVSASFVDFDGDGWLDLFVVNYLDYAPERDKLCLSERGEPDYCHPLHYPPAPSRLFRNRGDGTFEDVSKSSGVGAKPSNGLGIVASDFDEDGRVDFFVANDTMANHLWLNRGDGRFAEEAMAAGCALSGDGRPEACMGVDAGDIDGDGDEDLFTTNFRNEKNTLYRNLGKGVFSDASVESGLANASWVETSFGTAFFDYDNDGWLDLLVANGAVALPPEVDLAKRPYPLDEPDQLFRNRGDGTFEDVTARAGEGLALPDVGRAVLFGDVDNDGDADAVVLNNSGPARLLLNQVGASAPWLGVRLLETAGGRDAHATRLTVGLGNGAELGRRVRVDGSYAASNDPRVLVGLGVGASSTRVRVQWHGGPIEQWPGVRAGRYAVLHRSETDTSR